MKIEELLNANNSANKADEVWNHILETAKAESKRLIDQWHRDLENDPNTPHPVHILERELGIS
jgi:hypothetical protein